MNTNRLAVKPNLLSLLRFSFPTIVMMIFNSIYTMVDGIFVSNFVGADALSAINIVYPFMFLVIGIGVMLGTGGSAIIARKMGENDLISAREDFSLLIITGLVISVIMQISGFIFCTPLIEFLGSTQRLMPYCRNYLLYNLIGLPAFMLQMMFQSLFVTAGRPKLGMSVTIMAGTANILLDYIFVKELGIGIRGAAIATDIGYFIPAVIGLIVFCSKKNSLYFTRPKWQSSTIIRTCTNGSSEMVTNLACSVINLMFNLITMRIAGETGVAAITIVLYSQFLFTAVFLGFSTGVAPVISYRYGENNTAELKKLFKTCMTIIMFFSLVSVIFAFVGDNTVVSAFAKRGTEEYKMAIQGFPIFSVNYMFAGVSIFSSSMFTALSNGKISALISFVRSFLFIVVSLAVFPRLFNMNGVWISVPVAEIAGFILSIICIIKNKNEYKYI